MESVPVFAFCHMARHAGQCFGNELRGALSCGYGVLLQLSLVDEITANSGTDYFGKETSYGVLKSASSFDIMFRPYF